MHAYNPLNGFLSPLHENHHSKKYTSKNSVLLKIQKRGGVTEESDFGCGERAVCSQCVGSAMESDVNHDHLMLREEKCWVTQSLS